MMVLTFAVTETHIQEKHVDEVKKQIGSNSNGELNLVLHTDGGVPYSAVKIVMLLQSRFKKINTIIPDRAMSAGTLMAFGTDAIYMDEESVLGPLDLPIEHPTDGSRISSLDVQNTIVTIGSLADALATDWYDSARKNSRLGKKDCQEIAYSAAVELLKPLVQGIDPYHLQKSMRESRIALQYGTDLLMSRMCKGNFKRAYIIARKFVNDFPAHEYGIFKHEAQRLGLNTLSISSLANKETILKTYNEQCSKNVDDLDIIKFEVVDNNK